MRKNLKELWDRNFLNFYPFCIKLSDLVDNRIGDENGKEMCRRNLKRNRYGNIRN